MAELLANNMNAVRAQEKKTGQRMLVHVNHPNFQWALTAEDMLELEGTPFFEVYNAHGYLEAVQESREGVDGQVYSTILAMNERGRITAAKAGSAIWIAIPVGISSVFPGARSSGASSMARRSMPAEPSVACAGSGIWLPIR